MVEWKGKREEELRWKLDGDRGGVGVRRHEKGVKNGVRGDVGGG